MTYPSSPRGIDLAIIRIDYQNPSAVNISKVFSASGAAPDGVQVSGVILNEDAVAAIIETPNNSSSVFFARCQEGVVHRVQVTAPTGSTLQPGCIIIDHGFIITVQHLDSVVEVIHIRNPSTQSALAFAEYFTPAIPHFTTEPTRAYARSGCNTCHPQYGVLNITSRIWCLQDDEDTQFHTLYFWPAEYDSSNLTVGSLSLYEHSRYIQWISVGNSATSAIIMDVENSLGLVRYVTQPSPHVDFRPLEIPDFKVKRGSNIASDDALGIFVTKIRSALDHQLVFNRDPHIIQIRPGSFALVPWHMPYIEFQVLDTPVQITPDDTFDMALDDRLGIFCLVDHRYHLTVLSFIADV
ncbi:hypothetical protein B0H11DRAFT_2261175 [Mycena galericulata]|nr:hypothetical protein B0H11DRAFT_2261175 [Mycena galericulata]